MKLSIKNRIALYSVIGIAGISIIVFVSIYFTVKQTVYDEIDGKLRFEAQKYESDVKILKDSIYFSYAEEWAEREHIEVEVYPLFVVLYNEKGELLDKSPNLLSKKLRVDLSKAETQITNEKFGIDNIRQIQISLKENSKIEGFIVIAVPLRDAELIIQSLKDNLLIIFPILIIITFFTSRLISRITIKPITYISKTVDEINTTDLNKRVPKMSSGDELETLSNAINDFLDRIDAGIKREKQFTSDASHQLRTPLAVLKGNLEVLIRKPRQPEVYMESIKNNIKKIDEMTEALEKLLTLARLNSFHSDLKEVNEFSLNKQIETILTNYKFRILKKKLSIKFESTDDLKVTTHRIYLNLILDNLISNAIKYAFEETNICISVTKTKTGSELKICNSGQKIEADEFNKIFIPFYRNKEQESVQEGYGLGLAIVSKVSKLLNVKVSVNSEVNTCFKIKIPEHSKP